MQNKPKSHKVKHSPFQSVNRNSAKVRNHNANAQRRAASVRNGQPQGKRPASGGKKRVKINYKKFIPGIIVIILIITLFITLIAKLFGGAKAGWYNVYVRPGNGYKVGIVKSVSEDGIPSEIEMATKEVNGVYRVPVEAGGGTTIVVAEPDYSFNRINTFDRNFYLCTVTCNYSEKEDKNKKFQDKYSPSQPVWTSGKIRTEGNEKMPEIKFYAKKKGKNEIAVCKVGDKNPVFKASDLSYSGKERPAAPEKQDEVTDIAFTASGDNLIQQSVYEQAAARSKTREYDFDYCYENVAPFYKKHDLNWINQESLVNNKVPAKAYPNYSTPGEAAKSLNGIMGINIFSIANNHIYDQGNEGLKATMEFYKSEMPTGVIAAGLYNKNDLYDFPVITCKGKSVACLSYTYGTNNGLSDDSDVRVVTLDETEVIKKQIEKAKKETDIVVVGCHWGDTDSHVITTEQKKLAQDMADWGADIIVGTHPHAVQDAEWIKATDGRKVFCAYSLGNFISAQSGADQLIGLVLECKLHTVTSPNGDVTVNVETPLLYPVVTVYGPNYSNVHVEWLADYSESEAEHHGVRGNDNQFDYQYIIKLLKKNVDSDFLVLPGKTDGNGSKKTKEKDNANIKESAKKKDKK